MVDIARENVVIIDDGGLVTRFNIYHTLFSFLLAIFSRFILNLTHFTRICPVPGGHMPNITPGHKNVFFTFFMFWVKMSIFEKISNFFFARA